MTDPTGLMADDACDSGPMNLATCLTREYIGGGGGCSIDGGQADCGVAYGLAGIGAAARCPGNICSGFADLGNGTFAFAQFDPNSGMFNVIGKSFYPGLSPEQELDAINAQLNAVIDALEDKGATPDKITAFIDAAMDKYDHGGINLVGGNFDFPGADIFSELSSSSGCGHNRCDDPGIGTLDFSHVGENNNTFHLDTADPYPLFGRGMFVHGFVDVFLGWTWYEVIPRPWP